MTFRVAVVDDDSLVCQSICTLLRAAGYGVDGFVSPTSFLESVARKIEFHCVLLDERMSPINGLETFIQMRRQQCMIPAIMVTGVATASLTMQAIDSGFSYLLQKPIHSDQLVAKVTQYCDQYAKNASEKKRKARELEALAALSEREQQVLKQLANGLPNKQIAKDLGVGLRTVETYRQRVLEKIGADCLADAVAFAISVGLRAPGLVESADPLLTPPAR